MSESLPTDKPIDSEMEKLKIHSQSSPKEFSDLPTDALNLIIDRLELKERLILRKVSRGLGALVDDQKSILKAIRVRCEVDLIRLEFNNCKIVYVKSNSDSSQLYSKYGCQDAKLITSEDYLKIALGDLKSAVKNTKLQLDFFGVTFFPVVIAGEKTYKPLRKFSKQLVNILKSLDQKLSTKTFELYSQSASDTLAILPHMKPGNLRRIDTTGILPRIEQIAELDQWKQADELCIGQVRQDMIDENHIAHFKRLEFYGRWLGVEDLVRLRMIMSMSENLEYCKIHMIYGLFDGRGFEHIMDRLGKPTVPPKPHLRHHQIPGTNKYLEISFQPGNEWLTITKLTR